MPFPPQGLPRIAEWRERLNCPLVAIGGITLGNAPRLLAAGADCLAVISDLFEARDIAARARVYTKLFDPESVTPS